MLSNLALLYEAPILSVQLIIDGILIGAILALAAYGMALVWGVMNIINIAQGEFVMLGGIFDALIDRLDNGWRTTYLHHRLSPMPWSLRMPTKTA